MRLNSDTGYYKTVIDTKLKYSSQYLIIVISSPYMDDRVIDFIVSYQIYFYFHEQLLF